jgi:hypothetical protein
LLFPKKLGDMPALGVRAFLRVVQFAVGFFDFLASA